jgi:osmotically inducible lipoprotein OsmB
MMQSRTSVIAMLLAASLSGCAGMTRQQQETAIGAGVGGAAGYGLSGGSAAGTLGGAAVGGIVGHEWREWRD